MDGGGVRGGRMAKRSGRKMAVERGEGTKKGGRERKGKGLEERE